MLVAAKTLSHTDGVSARRLKRLISEHDKTSCPNGAYFIHDGNLYLAGAESQGWLCTSAAGEALLGVDNGLVVSQSEGKLYLLFKVNGALEAEFVVDPREASVRDKQQIISLVAFLNDNCDNHGIDYVCKSTLEFESAENGTHFGDLLALDVPLDKVQSSTLSSNVFSAETAIEVESVRRLRFKESGRLSFYHYLTASLLGIALLAWFLVFDDEEVVEDAVDTLQETLAAVKEINQSDYDALLSHYTESSVNPFGILRALSKEVKRTNLLLGWEPSEVVLQTSQSEGATVSLRLNKTFGSLADLNKYASDFSYRMNVEDNQGVLLTQLPTSPLFDNGAKFHIGSYETYFRSAMDDWYDDVSYSFEDSDTSFQGWKMRSIRVQVPFVYADDLASIGALFKGYPFSLESLSLIRSKQYPDAWDVEINYEFAGVEHSG